MPSPATRFTRSDLASAAVRVTEQTFDDAAKLQACTNIGAVPTDSGTLTTPAIAGGLSASGSGAHDFSGSTGAFLTSTGTNVFSGLILTTSVQNLTTATGTGIVNVTSFLTKLTSTGTDALSLANGTEGQLKRILHVVDGGDATLTPTTKTGFTTIVFSAVGQSALLQYHTTVGWTIVAVYGAVIS